MDEASLGNKTRDEPPPQEESESAGPDPEFQKDVEPIHALKLALKKKLAGLDGRRLRKYEYYDYVKVIDNMVRDDVLTENEDTKQLRSIFEDWKKYKSKKGQEVDERAKVAERARAALKKLEPST